MPRFKKGSAAAKKYMAKIRRKKSGTKKRAKVSGTKKTRTKIKPGFGGSGEVRAKIKNYEFEIGQCMAKLKFDKTASAAQRKIWRKKIAGYKKQHAALTKYLKTL